MSINVTIAKLNTLVTANAVQFTKEFSSLPNVANRAASGVNNALASIGAGVSIAGLIAFGKSVIDFGSQITDLSTMAGMSTDAFQTISVAGAESGVTMEMVAKSAETLRGKLQDAANGAQPVRDELGKLNLTVAQLAGLAPERQWEIIAQRIHGAKDQQEAMNIATDLFGAKNAPKMKELLDKLADGYDRLSASTKELRIDKAQLQTLDDAGDKLTNLWTKIKVLGANALVGGINVVKGDADLIMNAGPKGHRFGDSLKRVWDASGLGDGSSFRGGPLTQDDPAIKASLAKQNALALGKAMAQGAADYSKSHPFDAIRQDNAKNAEIKSLLNEVFGSLDEREKSLRDNRIKVDFPQAATDRLSRIGLLTGDGTTKASEDKKQTNLLDGIKKELTILNAKAFGSAATYQ